MNNSDKVVNLQNFFNNGVDEIYKNDPQLLQILGDEYKRQREELLMVASCSLTYPSVLACQGMVTTNVTAEGYPNMRYHAGCKEVDKIETLAIERAKNLFRAQYANLQPHSATTANEIVLFSLLKPGDKILGMNLNSGGHLSHGSSVSFSGNYFNSLKYGLDENDYINYDEIERIAIKEQPKLIICGTSAYSRQIDFKRYREIADKVGAYLLADISHISGLVVAGLHPSPIDYAHVTTACTHKQLFGPRGGIILSGRDAKSKIHGSNITIESHFQKAVFPFFQGAPMENMVAAKAMALKMDQSDEFVDIMKLIVSNARELAKELQLKGYKLISGGTDTHIVLVDLTNMGIDGADAEQALEKCGIIVNKNSVPNCRTNSRRPMGIRIGLNSLSQRGFGKDEMKICADLINMVLNKTVKRDDYIMVEENTQKYVREQVSSLCKKFPIVKYKY